MEAQNKRFDRSERIIENLKVSQTKMEKALQFANRKIRAVASGDVLPEDLEIDTVGVEALSAENRGVLPARASQHTSEAGVPGESSKAPSEAGDPVPTLVVYKPIKDGARMSSLKNKLKGERNSHRIDQNMTQSTVDKSGEEMGIIDHTPSMDSQDSLDSRGLVDDYMLGKIDTLDSTIREDLSVKVLELELNAERLQNTLKTLQDSVKELEKAAENAKEHPVEPEYDHASHVRKYFKGVTYEAKDGWERVFDELDKKVARMEYLIAQSGEKPDEYALRLIAYRAKMEKALEDIDASLATMKEAEASNAPDVKEVVLASLSPVLEGLMQESEAIAGLEATYKQNYDKKIPGQAIPISQMPSKLPDVITSANKKSTNFLDEGISHVALKKRLGEMETAIDERVCSSTFQKFDDDIRIALTLKADNKALEAVNIKKASCLELQKFREHVADEIDSMRELLVKNSANASKMLASVTSSKGDNGELAQRFDILYGQFQEVQRGVSAFVPRPEIELALQALLDEVKSVQRTTVDKDLLFEKLKKKADRGDVDRFARLFELMWESFNFLCRLLTLLSGSIGDPQNGFAAAMHKCLVCDKPTNPFNVADDSSSPTRVRPNQSATMRAGERTGSPSQGGRPATSSGALGRGRTVNTEVNILRNSMETLPPVHTPVGSGVSSERIKFVVLYLCRETRGKERSCRRIGKCKSEFERLLAVAFCS